MSARMSALILKEIKIIKKLLYGNGEKGLCERVRNLEVFYKWFTFASVALSIILAIKAL